MCNKRIIKNIIGFLGLIVVFLGACFSLNFIYVNPKDHFWVRPFFHEFYSLNQIDNIFVGCSHVYCDVNCSLLDSLNKKNNFNVATPAQRLDDSYYLIKESVERYNVSHVYLECYYLTLVENKDWNREKMQYEMFDYIDKPSTLCRPWQIAYEMRPSINQLLILLSAMKKDNVAETIFPFLRYRENLFNKKQIRTNISYKRKKEYKEFKYSENYGSWSREYQPKGYCWENGIYNDKRKSSMQYVYFSDDRDKYSSEIGYKSELYLRKCIDYCISKNIPITLFVSPIYVLDIFSTENYDYYFNFLQKIAQEYQIELFDFNLIRSKYLDIQHGEYFNDISHLNNKGAELFTRCLNEVMTSSNNTKKFYSSFKERLENEPPEIYGVYYKYTNPSKTKVNQSGSPYCETKEFIIATNRNMDFLVKTTKSGKEEKIIQNTVNNRFEMPNNSDHGVIDIEGVFKKKNYKLIVSY